MQNKEIEIKFRISPEERKNIEDFVVKNAKFISESMQQDTYFMPKHRSYIEETTGYIFEWLRLRVENGNNFLTYKNVFRGDNNKGREKDEFETLVDDAEVIRNIIFRMDFQELISFKKHRKKYSYKENFEICLDNVTEIGDFVEIEIKGNYESAEHAEKEIEKIANELNIDFKNESIMGYAHLMLVEKGLAKMPKF